MRTSFTHLKNHNLIACCRLKVQFFWITQISKLTFFFIVCFKFFFFDVFQANKLVWEHSHHVSLKYLINKYCAAFLKILRINKSSFSGLTFGIYMGVILRTRKILHFSIIVIANSQRVAVHFILCSLKKVIR